MIYTVSDSSNNKETVIRTIEKKDVNAPVITLKGGENYYVTQMVNIKILVIQQKMNVKVI